MGNLFLSLLAGVPDALTAYVYLTAWVSPEILGPEYVKNLMLVMLIELFTVLAAGTYGGFAARSNEPIGKRLIAFTGWRPPQYRLPRA